MALDDDRADMPLLDAWRADIGDETIAAVVQRARAEIAEGSRPGFSDKGRFLEHLRDAHPRTA